jgi:hypothetical protein
MRAERQRFAKEPILSGRLSAKENRDLGFVKAMSALPPKRTFRAAISMSALFERSAVPTKIESQSANKQCHHLDRRHKTALG